MYAGLHVNSVNNDIVKYTRNNYSTQHACTLRKTKKKLHRVINYYQQIRRPTTRKKTFCSPLKRLQMNLIQWNVLTGDGHLSHCQRSSDVQ